MYRLTSKLVVYKNMGEDCLLLQLSEIIKEYDSVSRKVNAVIERENITSQISRYSFFAGAE